MSVSELQMKSARRFPSKASDLAAGPRQIIRTRVSPVILLVIISVVSIVPTLGIEKPSTLRWFQLYRVTVLLFSVLYALRHSIFPKRFFRPYYLVWVMLIGYCMLTGALSQGVPSYVDVTAARRELLSFLLGFLVIFLFSQFDLSYSQFASLLRIAELALCVLICIGCWEIATGSHMATSFYNASNNLQARMLDQHMATGFNYNVNDFSALITSLFPVVLFEKSKVKPWVFFTAIFFVNTVNDANICNVALLVCVAIWLSAHLWKMLKHHFGGAFILLVPYALLVIGIGLYGLNLIMNLRLGSSMSTVLATQLQNYAGGSGSMYSRVAIYGDAVAASARNHLLGYGPGSFANYFKWHPSASGLVNPHGLLFELLFEYGALAVVLFVYALGQCGVISLKQLRQAGLEDRRPLVALCLTAAYFVTSFAPSSFIGYSHQWLVTALICSLLGHRKDIVIDEDV